MIILDRLINYANDCLNDIIISGDKHKKACKRFLRDVDYSNSDSSCNFYWDDENANKIIEWFKLLKHSKGILAGNFIDLTIWQQFVLCQIYGWRLKNTNIKRFKNAFILVGRKNAKSQMQAGCILYEMSVQSQQNNEIYECYCAGTKREQSKIIFDECRNLLKGSPIQSKFKVTNYIITHLKTSSFLKALNKEDGQKGDGTNPAVLVIDEYHQHPTTEFYDLGLGANTKDSIVMIISTAGTNLNYPCYVQEYKYCSEILNNSVFNDSYFVDILEVDQNDDISDFNNWHKANPVRMSYQNGIDKLQADFNISVSIPDKLVMFKTKCLNVWVNAGVDKYLDYSKWETNICHDFDMDLTNFECYVGFDMSSKIDLTSVSFIIPIDYENRRKYVIYSHSFIPNIEKLNERIQTDKKPYDSWVDRGFITLTNSPVIDQNVVVDYVLRFCKEHNFLINTMCFDINNASKLMLEMSDLGYNVEEIYQSYRALNEVTHSFRECVYNNDLIILDNPVLNYSVSNAIIKSTSDNLIKIDKNKKTSRIDPLDAVMCAFKLANFHGDLQSFNLGNYLDKLDSLI